SEAQELLELAVQVGAIKYGDFTLSSGQKSSYYFDGRLLSLYPAGAYLIGRLLLPIVRKAGAQAIGGPTLGADPIVAAVALTSHLQNTPVPAFIVRKEAKGHGTGQLIEGPLAKGTPVAIVDDVCTTGGSLFHAIAAAEAHGCTVAQVIAILDRRQGGGDELRKRGYRFTAVLEATPEGRVRVAGS
ncbi:MAG: orotate phosphoribosyltransferase, partial [Chloroflexota bacterium]|nr:orotate phosphoribosyltransferase [Chloroflexota bacterium]